jgi:hypothetical protein
LVHFGKALQAPGNDIGEAGVNFSIFIVLNSVTAKNLAFTPGEVEAAIKLLQILLPQSAHVQGAKTAKRTKTAQRPDSYTSWEEWKAYVKTAPFEKEPKEILLQFFQQNNLPVQKRATNKVLCSAIFNFLGVEKDEEEEV